MSFRVRGSSAILGLVLFSFTGCLIAGAATEGTFDRVLTVSEGLVDLDVRTGSGRIEVRAGEPGSVRIHAVIRARGDRRASAEEKIQYLESNPPIEQSGNTIRIGRIDDRAYSNNVSISYEIFVPSRTRLESSTGSGSQTIEDIRGPVNASTGSGSITMVNIGDEVEANTGSGSIKLDSIEGDARARTGSGGIRAIGVAGAFNAGTGSGSIVFEQTAPGDVRVSTGSGGIEGSGIQGAVVARTGSGRITLSGEPTGDWDIQGSSGGVKLRLSSGVSFDLHAHADSGKITVDHPLSVTGTMSRKEIRGKVRGGGSLVKVRSGSGNIVIQ